MNLTLGWCLLLGPELGAGVWMRLAALRARSPSPCVEPPFGPSLRTSAATQPLILLSRLGTICTDYESQVERNHQLKLAPRIYYEASEIVVWLGPNDFYPSHAMDMLGKEIWSSDILLNDLSMDTVRFWIGLCEMMLNSYWERAETVQELTLPSNAVLMQGEHLLSTDKLKDRSTAISRSLSKHHTELSKDLYQQFQLMLKRSGLSAFLTLRESVQRYKKKEVSPIAYLRCSSKELSTMWTTLATAPTTHCGEIKKRIFSTLAFTQHGIDLNVDTALNPFKLFLECVWLEHDSEDVAVRLKDLGRLLALTPASILMYTTELGKSFRIPGSTDDCVASTEYRRLYEVSSASAENRKMWQDTGLAGPEPSLEPYFVDKDLGDLHWVNGTGDSEAFSMPQKCQLRIAMRAGRQDVFLLPGIYFKDEKLGSVITSPADMEAMTPLRDMSDEEFENQATIRCCCDLGIYETTCSPLTMLIYYAILDGSVYTDNERLARASKYGDGDLRASDRNSMVWTTRETNSETPLLGPSGVPATNFDTVYPMIDTGADTVPRLSAKWEDSVVLRGHKSSIGTVAFSPSGRTLISYSADDTVRLWDTTTGFNVATLKGINGSTKALAVSKIADFLAHDLSNGEIQIWRLTTAEKCRTIVGRSKWGQVTAIAFSPNGRLIASSYINQAKILLWNLEADDQPELLEDYRHFAAVTALDFSPDGRLLASGSTDKSLVIWDVANTKIPQRFMGHTGTVLSVSFSPDSCYVASGSPDKTVRLWKVGTADAICVLRGHEDVVASVHFSPDGNSIVSGSDDGTVRIWDVKTEETVHKLTEHSNGVISVEFHPKFPMIASGSQDGTIRLRGVRKLERPTMLGQLDDLRKQGSGEIVHLFRRASNAIDTSGNRKQGKGTRDKDMETEDEQYELEEWQTTGRQSEDLTHRRTFTRSED